MKNDTKKLYIFILLFTILIGGLSYNFVKLGIPYYIIAIIVSILISLSFAYYKISQFDWFKELTDKDYLKFKELYHLYRTRVLEEEVRYDIFVNEYCNSNIAFTIKSDSDYNSQNGLYNQIKNILENRSDLVEKYFSIESFGYSDYLNLIKEYNTTEIEKDNSVISQSKYTPITLRKKILILESLFDICNVKDVSLTNKARFIRDLLGIELNTEKITNTNVYKYLKENQNAPNEKKKILALIQDKEYTIHQLSLLGLQNHCNKIKNEIESYKDGIVE